jgi:Putative porin
MWHYSSFLIRVMNRPALLSAFWLCASTLGVQAQTTRPEIIAQPPTAASATTRPQSVPDEPLLYTYALTPEKSEPAADTLPDANFRMYNPARRPLIDYGTTGNLGSSARPMLYEVRPQRGFDFGMHSFELYSLRPQDLRFYRNARAFSDAFFSQGRNNLEAMVNARFARTFSGGTNVSLDYRTVNNLGQYNYQRDRHNALSAGIWLPVGKRYDGFLIYTKNVMRQQENGGIVSDDVFSGAQFQGPAAAAIRLSDEKAYTRYDEQSMHLTQHYRFTGGGVGKRALRATHTFEWGKQQYKFSDGDTIRGLLNDTVYFANFLVDDRGLRHFTELNRFDNTFTINTFKAKKPGQPSDLVALGLAHSFFKLNQEPNRYTFSNLFLTGNIHFRPSERFEFKANAALGLLDNIGEYQLQGALTLGLGKAGELRASLLSQRRPPGLFQQRLFVSKRPVWATNFDKPVENTLSASYALPLIGFEATARTTILNNYTYFDQRSLPVQTGAPLQILQLVVTENLKLGWFHFDNTVALQRANRSDVFRLPEWFTKNSVYVTGKVFKKRLLLATGVDFRMNSAFLPDAYQPLTGQFHLQDSLSQQPYPWLDVFLAFKVQSFRFSIRYENCSTWWDKTQVFYQTAFQPQPFGGLRFSIAWRFMDNNLKAADTSGGAGSQNGNPTLGGFGGKKGG